MKVNKEASLKYIIDEEIEFLGKVVGHNFEKPEKEVVGYESINVELMAGSNYKEWVKASLYASLVTWDTTPQIPISKLLKATFKEQEEKLMFMLNQRPISVALEGAVFTFKLTGIPRSMTHQIVRHRQMSFGQQSYRVSSCYSDPVRIPVTLEERLHAKENYKQEDLELYKEYIDVVKSAREVYKKLIQADVPMEQARNIMPMGTCTKIGVTMRLRDMIDYFKGRTSGIAQDEHTYMVCLIAKEMKDKKPEFFKFIKSKATNLEKIMKEYEVE